LAQIVEMVVGAIDKSRPLASAGHSLESSITNPGLGIRHAQEHDPNLSGLAEATMDMRAAAAVAIGDKVHLAVVGVQRDP
jgi:hypothetical protein